ncbi:MAG: response regulator [Nitrospira sp.]|nr:response regulator [bacterium]MBL7049216.1 response regulator [Nitrospira sp.]
MRKILIVDDDIEMRSVLGQIITSIGCEPLTAGNGKKALAMISENLPDLVILDIRLPDMGGLDILAKIMEISKSLPVVMLTGFGDIKDAVQSIKTGAFDYITKPFDNDDLIAIIQSATKGKCNVSTGDEINLSDRETEVLSWIRHGKSSGDIAIILNISERTVNFHVKNIMYKFHVTNRTHAIALAIEKGMLPND